MTKLTKMRKSKRFQKIIAKAMYNKSNTNIKGDTSFAEIQAERDEVLNKLYEAILPVSNPAQAQRIIDIVKLGLRGNDFIDAMPIMAVGDVMAFIRIQVRDAIKQVRSYKAVETVIELDHARSCQRCEDMIAIYMMVQKSYYTLYKRFMAECNKPQISWKA